MSGTLVLSDDATWMPTGWVFDTVLRLIATELQRHDVLLSSAIEQATSRRYGDLRALDTGQVVELREAAERCYTALLKERPFLPPLGVDYFTLMFCFSQLKALLRTDTRTPVTLCALCQFMIGSSRIWRAPGWLYNMVLEHFEAYLAKEDELLAAQLIGGRVVYGSGSCDVRELGPDQVERLVAASEWMYRHYGDGLGRVSHAPSFFALLAPYIIELFTLLTTDARAANGWLR